MNRTPTLRPVPIAKETPAQRAAGLLAQAKEQADQHVAQIIAAMGDLAREADEASAGGEVYPPGVREELRRMADDLVARASRVSSIMDRAGR